MIIFGGGSPKSMLVYGLVSIAILAFSYFVIIKPITNDANKTVTDALNQFNTPTVPGSSSSGSNSGSSSGNATADDVYNACIKAIHGATAGKPGCESAKSAFQSCADQAANAGLSQDSALQACQDAANQTVSALKAAS